MTEKELKEDLKRQTKDTSWSGRIIGYKLTPILEATNKTRIHTFKIKKNIFGR